MEKQEFEVDVTVRRVSVRKWTTKVTVLAYTHGAALAVAEGKGMDEAGDVDFNQFAEASVHYTAEASNPAIK